MLYIYYKDKLNSRQNKPFIDYFKKIKSEVKFVSKVDDIIIDRNNNIDIFVGTFEFFEVFLKFLFKRNVRIIYRSRGVAPEESFYRNSSRIRYYVLSLIEFLVINLSKHIIVVSNKHKNHYIKKYKVNSGKISVIHNYLTKDSYQIKESNMKKMEVVYVGGMSKWQMVENVKDIFIRLGDKNKQLSFLVCTSEHNINEAKEVFKDVNNISFESYTDYNDLINRISNCTAGIILRDSNKVNECSSPFKIIDYISAQLPIIMTQNIGDYSETLSNNRFFYHLEDINCKDKEITNLESFIQNSFKNSTEIKREMSLYAQKELDAESEIKSVMFTLEKI